MNLTNLQKFVDSKQVELEIKQQDLEKITKKIADLEEQNVVREKARVILVEVGRQTQETFSGYVESLVTTALQSVFPDDTYEFKVNFEYKRNQSECYMRVIKNGFEMVPEDDMGGSILDICGFALRIVMWSLQKEKTRPVFILDEPFKNLGHGENMLLAGKMLKEIHEKLGVQIIMVSHEDELKEIADKTFVVTHDGIESFVEVIGEEE